MMDESLPGAIDDLKNILSDEQRSELHATTDVAGTDTILVFIDMISKRQTASSPVST